MAGGGNPFAPPGSGGAIGTGAPIGGGPVRQPNVQASGASLSAPAPPTPPGAGRGNSMGVPPSKQGQPFADVHQNLKYVQNQFKQGQQAQQVLDHLRVELDSLMEMGDIVRPEHVIEAAGRLVGHGIGATQLAQIMSDMPAQGGEALASWIRMHDIVVSNAERQLVLENRGIQHNMGIAAVSAMAATHLESRANQMASAVPNSGEGQTPEDNQLQPSTMSMAPSRGRPPGS